MAAWMAVLHGGMPGPANSMDMSGTAQWLLCGHSREKRTRFPGTVIWAHVAQQSIALPKGAYQIRSKAGWAQPLPALQSQRCSRWAWVLPCKL